MTYPFFGTPGIRTVLFQFALRKVTKKCAKYNCIQIVQDLSNGEWTFHVSFAKRKYFPFFHKKLRALTIHLIASIPQSDTDDRLFGYHGNSGSRTVCQYRLPLPKCTQQTFFQYLFSERFILYKTTIQLLGWPLQPHCLKTIFHKSCVMCRIISTKNIV